MEITVKEKSWHFTLGKKESKSTQRVSVYAYMETQNKEDGY
jgi:hypothetical protein